MKKIKSIALLLAVAALVLSSCSNDVLLADETGGNGPGESYSGKSVFITAGVGLPTSAGTRSQTDSADPDDDNNNTNSNGNGETDEDGNFVDPDFEYGYDYENDVRTMILVFATEDNKFIASSKVLGIEKAPTGNTKKNYEFQVTAELKYEDLQKAYTGENAPLSNYSGDDLCVYAFCNYTADLEEKLLKLEAGNTDWINLAGEVKENAAPVGTTPVISNTIWANRAFLMTNYQKRTTVFPSTIGDWDEYADPSTPFFITADGEQPIDPENPNLAAIKVERSAARIDFRDGSPDPQKTPNTYPVLTDVHEMIENPSPNDDYADKGELNLFSVQLTRMALVNMSKNFYYLRRVSVGGYSDADVTVGGLETASNYVIDVDAKAKNLNETAELIDVDNANDYFNFPLYKKEGDKILYNREGWYADEINDILDSESKDHPKDTWSQSTSNNYKIWRYVTENTIPAKEENQITVQSTGIVFKGRIVAGENIEDTYDTDDEYGQEETYVSEEVRSALSNVETGKLPDGVKSTDLPLLYSFNGFLYAGWKELIIKGAEEGVNGPLYERVEKILKALDLKLTDSGNYTSEGTGEVLDIETAYTLLTTYPDDNKIELDDEAVRELAPDPGIGITVYAASDDGDGEGWGYYCYYFYWNRHNDNEKSGIMGNMEFATVRNNVYKIAVTDISKFGHPINRDDDPDPVDPEDPDEEPIRYIQVDVEVLPWVVRVNNVKF